MRDRSSHLKPARWPSGHVSTIDSIRRALEDLNRAERQVAEVVLADIAVSTRMSTRELAERAAVSEPTVVRFARRVGCRGFTDLKQRLAEDFATARMFVPSDNAKISHDSDLVAKQVYEATAQALASSFTQRDPGALKRAAAAIDAAQRVFCMGTGGSSANIAEEAENRLFRFDVHVTALTDSYKQRIAAATCNAQDVLLVFSVTGLPRALVESAGSAREAGAEVVAVTRVGSPLAAASTILLPLHIPDNDQHFEIPNRSRYGQLYVLDCLATLVASRRLESSVPKLRRARAALQRLHGETEHQPIGD
jgi:RpiR family transcriptional regulator, carbohydrate utilization regulator